MRSGQHACVPDVEEEVHGSVHRPLLGTLLCGGGTHRGESRGEGLGNPTVPPTMQKQTRVPPGSRPLMPSEKKPVGRDMEHSAGCASPSSYSMGRR